MLGGVAEAIGSPPSFFRGRQEGSVPPSDPVRPRPPPSAPVRPRPTCPTHLTHPTRPTRPTPSGVLLSTRIGRWFGPCFQIDLALFLFSGY